MGKNRNYNINDETNDNNTVPVEEINDNNGVLVEEVKEESKTVEKEVTPEDKTKEVLENKLAFYKDKLSKTANVLERARISDKMDKVQKELNAMKAKPLDKPTINTRIADPILGDRKDNVFDKDSRGTVINNGGGSYSIVF